MSTIPLLLWLSTTPAFAVSDAVSCNAKPDCVWVVNGSGTGHCLCKLAIPECPPLEPMEETEPEFCFEGALAAPATWSCDAGDGPFVHTGPAWDDGSHVGHLVIDERLATCTTRRPKLAPDGKAATTFLLGQLTEAAAAWARAQNYVVELGRALLVAEDYTLELEVELDAYDAQRLCFMRVSTANPGTTLEQAQRLCPL